MLRKTPNILSKEYYQFVDNFAKTDFESEKILGKFCTDYDIADNMIDIICRCFCAEDFASNIKIIDPFCGDGRLIIKLLEGLRKVNKINNKSVCLVFWDIDKNAVKLAEKNISSFIAANNICCNIEGEVLDAYVEYKNVQNTFDICITNPPWGLLKPQKLFSKSNSKKKMEDYCKVTEQYDNYMKEEFLLSQPSSKFGKWGTNLARCGVEVALRLIKPNGICGIVSPASLLNDQVSSKLRKWIFEKYKVVNVSYYPAELKLYGSADISSITMVVKGGKTNATFTVKVYSSKVDYKCDKIEKATFEYIKQHNYNIPLKTGIDSIPVMMHLARLIDTKEFCDSVGLKFTRELDETKLREKLVQNGKFEFAKGYMVGRYSFEGDDLYLNEDMVVVPYSAYCYKIVWRDVSRDSQIRRLKATLLPPGYICGNSLGVIYGEEEQLPFLKMLLGIMNSLIYEYQARGMLVSNHVSAGIVKQIHVPEPRIDSEIKGLVDRQLRGEDVEIELEVAIAKFYGVSLSEYKLIVDSFSIPSKTKEILAHNYEKESRKIGEKEHMIFNHYAANLSDLDMQVVRCVPPGGNWKNIPESVPSQRLAQIRESYKAGKGSRSTYYGRLRADMPAYTINTYFNRPGNGCNIHYDQDRTLSQREAARFQSFPDSFEFIGSRTAINNQIGNAVPPLLAYQIAKHISFKGQFIDLFCGAGGLALGFVWAGWKPIVGNDNDNYAIETHKRNIGSNAILGDINSQEVHDEIISRAILARNEHPELPLFVLGGPPCQGFSTANTRKGAKDMRNWLFKSYVNIVKEIRPEGFVFENVRGILNLDHGGFFEMITQDLKACVPDIKVNQISAVNYGVPQRRERVIIIGGNTEFVHNFCMDEITCVSKNGQITLLPQIIGAEDAISDLPSIQPGEDGSSYDYRFPAVNPYQKFMRGEITAEDYLKSYAIV